MDAFSFFKPISYNTDVMSFLYCYNNGLSPMSLPYINFSTPNITYNNTYNSNYYPLFNFTGNLNANYQTSNFGGNYYNFTGSSSSNPTQTYYNFTGTSKPSSSYASTEFVFTGTKKSSEETSELSSATTTSTNSSTSNNAVTVPDTKSNLKKNSDIRKSFASNAKKYLNYSEKKGESKLFSSSPEWCADFVTYVVKETYKEKGLEVPTGFGNHRVENLRKWGIENDKYLCLTDKADKAKTIIDNVKVGDILILRENGASHTGFVTKINKKTGNFETIEGNVTINGDDKVVTNKYSPYYKDISGFVQLS